MLHTKSYNMRDALAWGLCSKHYEEASHLGVSCSGAKHLTLAVLETIPVLSQIVSLIDFIICHYLFPFIKSQVPMASIEMEPLSDNAPNKRFTQIPHIDLSKDFHNFHVSVKKLHTIVSNAFNEVVFHHDLNIDVGREGRRVLVAREKFLLHKNRYIEMVHSTRGIEQSCEACIESYKGVEKFQSDLEKFYVDQEQYHLDAEQLYHCISELENMKARLTSDSTFDSDSSDDDTDYDFGVDSPSPSTHEDSDEMDWDPFHNFHTAVEEFHRITSTTLNKLAYHYDETVDEEVEDRRVSVAREQFLLYKKRYIEMVDFIGEIEQFCRSYMESCDDVDTFHVDQKQYHLDVEQLLYCITELENISTGLATDDDTDNNERPDDSNNPPSLDQHPQPTPHNKTPPQIVTTTSMSNDNKKMSRTSENPPNDNKRVSYTNENQPNTEKNEHLEVSTGIVPKVESVVSCGVMVQSVLAKTPTFLITPKVTVTPFKPIAKNGGIYYQDSPEKVINPFKTWTG